MGRFGDALAEQAGGMVGGAVGAGMGMLLGPLNDARQLNQQRKLNGQQWEFDKRAIDYNWQKQLDMWNATNYGAQMEHLKKAGLNPGLIYGMGGAGGATTGGGGGSVRANAAPAGGREAQDMMGMGLQMQLVKAQKDVLESQAEKNRAEANKTKGVDTVEAETRIKSLTQGIENQKAVEILTRAETFLKNMEGVKQSESMDDQLDYIHWNAKQAMNSVKLAEQEVYINSNVLDSKITIIRQEAIGAALRNALTKAQTDKTVSDVSVNVAQIDKWAQDIAQGWEGLSRQERELKIKDFEAELKEKFPGVLNVLGKNLNEFVENIFSLTPRRGWKPSGVESGR